MSPKPYFSFSLLRGRPLVAALILAASPLLFSTSAAAHPGQGERGAESGERNRGRSLEERVEHHLRRLTRRLELNEDQVALARPILLRHAPSPGTLRALSREDRHARMADIRTAVRSDLEEVLTPDQLERFDAMRFRHRRGHGARGLEHRLERMTELLELTTDQADRVRSVFDAAHTRRAEIRELDGEARRDARQALKSEVRASLSEILSEDQMARLREHREERRSRRNHRRGG